MKLKLYIKELQAVLEKHGNLECYYAHDDEGNVYQQVRMVGSIGFVDELNHIVEYVYSVQDMENLVESPGFIEHAIPICVVN